MMSNILTIADKEVRSYLASPAVYIVMIIFLSLTGWFFSNTLFIDGGRAEMSSHFNLIPFLFLFFIPAITMKMISEEKKSGTLESLLTLPLMGKEIIIGKFAGSLIVVTAAVLFTFPNLLTVGILGKPDWGIIITGYLGLLLLGASLTSIGIYSSTITDNQILAFILSFFAIFILIMLDDLLIFLPFSEFFEYISIKSHYDNMLKGIIDTKDLIYFISIILLFLTAASESIESKRK
ncbi:MAG: ABC transporter permease subunit [Candidatus Delongbacteria bacterium]